MSTLSINSEGIAQVVADGGLTPLTPRALVRVNALEAQGLAIAHGGQLPQIIADRKGALASFREDIGEDVAAYAARLEREHPQSAAKTLAADRERQRDIEIALAAQRLAKRDLTRAQMASFGETERRVAAGLKKMRGLRLIDADEVPGKANPAALAAVITEANGFIRTTNEQPEPIEHAIRELEQDVRNAARAPVVSLLREPVGREADLFRYGMSFEWPKISKRVVGGFVEGPDVLGLLCHYFGEDLLLPKLKADLAAAYARSGVLGISEADRKKQITHLITKRAKAERELAALLWNDFARTGQINIELAAPLSAGGFLGVRAA